ncbi:PilZ domain-containing protein [Sphingomonas sp. ASV193]|uniref:PilZ domain-containing protein n=1 Tax=Sphingomonas sp. ASV193 TaxID=3144405 RepID=UPI0032E8D5DE
MIPRTVKRMFDQRSEPRLEPSGDTAVMTARGASAAVRLVNVSASGAMVASEHALHIGERIRLQLLEQGEVAGQVRWIRDGHIGIHFAAPLE